MDINKIKTFGELKKSGYSSKSIKQEMRNNLAQALKEGKNTFEGIVGFEDTVIPHVQSALLSKHNMILLGLRGQAKTRIARLMVNLLDDYIPIVEGSEINDDPFNPLSHYARTLMQEKGDDIPISWVGREQRYAEKLATPDVSVADLIGDVDPIKAAVKKLEYADERVIHFGMIPRANRSIFVINELPDLQARIQVALFNILQEGDLQIRGFKFRLPLDIQFVFTANPEDYTNRGSIVTPLKDRIGSQILTHYPVDIDKAAEITKQEAKVEEEQAKNIKSNDILARLVEQIAFEARNSEYIDQKSGVSARLTISAFENLYSVAERRMLIAGDSRTNMRISDLYGIVPAITGKVELVYEGEMEGISSVAFQLIGKAIRQEFLSYFDDPSKIKKSKVEHPFNSLLAWFADGNEIELENGLSNAEYDRKLKDVPYLKEILATTGLQYDKEDIPVLSEMILFGLAEFSQISKTPIESGVRFRDIMSGMLNFQSGYEDEEEL